MIHETTEKIVQIKNRLLTVPGSRLENLRADEDPKPLGILSWGDMVTCSKVSSPWRKGVVCFESGEKLKGIHSTFYVLNLKKCVTEGDIVASMDEIQLDDNLHMIEKPVEIVDREVKQLNRSQIPIRIKTTEGKVDTSKALDASLVDTESSGTESEKQYTSSKLRNDIHADDTYIRPIYDEEPMVEVQTTSDHNVFATKQQHNEQLEFNNEREVDQNA
ncbi:hypothetical protein Tco_0548983 [Tanacetum coccineum]